MTSSAQDTFKARIQLAVDLMNQERWEEAERLMEDLLQKHPFNPYVLFNRGVVHWHFARVGEAIQCYRKALGADPTFLPAMVNLSNVLAHDGDYREALRYAQMAIRRQPGNPALLLNLSSILAPLGEYDDVVGAMRDALRIKPDYHRARAQLMTAYEELNRLSEAKEEALALVDTADLVSQIQALTTLCNLAKRESDWTSCNKYIPRLVEALGKPDIPPLNPMAFAFYADDPALMRRLADSQGLQLPAQTQARRRWAGGMITVAYLSPDFRDHPVAHMLYDVLRSHDRSRYRTIAVSVVPLDDSKQTQAICSLFDGVIDLSKLDDTQAMQALQQAGVDVLVDIAGTTKWNRVSLLARRCCPAQVLWLGCPVSTGAHYYDAFLLDHVVAPPGYEAYCTEPILRLPGCYHPISLGIEAKPSAITRADLHLPTDAIIVGMLQQPPKIRPPLVDRVASTIAPYPNVHLWLRAPSKAHTDIRRRLIDLGVSDERIHLTYHFPERSNYLAALRLADIAVDTYPYGGHSTTGETLLMGTPVLTFPGRSVHARVAASMLAECGLGDLIQESLEGMLVTLQQLLCTPTLLTTWKERFRAGSSNYCNGGITRLTRSLEDSYRRLLAPPAD